MYLLQKDESLRYKRHDSKSEVHKREKPDCKYTNVKLFPLCEFNE